MCKYIVLTKRIYLTIRSPSDRDRGLRSRSSTLLVQRGEKRVRAARMGQHNVSVARVRHPRISPSQFIMVLGRLAHYAIDALLLSTVVAGVKRSTGFTCVSYCLSITLSLTAEKRLFSSLDTEFISNPTVRSLTEQYLGVGESMFNTLQGAVVTSPYFKRSDSERR